VCPSRWWRCPVDEAVDGLVMRLEEGFYLSVIPVQGNKPNLTPPPVEKPGLVCPRF